MTNDEIVQIVNQLNDSDITSGQLKALEEYLCKLRWKKEREQLAILESLGAA